MIETQDTDDELSQEDILSSFRQERLEQRKKRPAIIIGTTIGIVVAISVGWATFGRYVSVYYGADSGELPIIRADSSIDGMKPDSPGGMEVPNRDKLVYERLRQSNTELPVERLLPSPEKPSTPEPVVALVVEPKDDPLAALVAEVVAQEDTLAAAVVYEEDGTPVEVMFSDEEKAPVVEVKPAPEPKPVPVPAPVAEQKKPEKAEAKQPVKVAEKTAEKPAKAAPVVPPAKEFYSVQLVSARSNSAAESEWKRLSKKHKDIFAGQPYFISKTVVASGTFYRLRVGRFDTHEGAKALCNQLKAKKQECFVVK